MKVARRLRRMLLGRRIQQVIVQAWHELAGVDNTIKIVLHLT
jgi:hypothetical protein